jgi:hypothetical protein
VVEFTWLPWGLVTNGRVYDVVDAHGSPIAREIRSVSLARLVMYAPDMLEYLRRASTLCPATDTDTMMGKELHELLHAIYMPSQETQRG